MADNQDRGLRAPAENAGDARCEWTLPSCSAASMSALCGCALRCGDDGDVDGPGVCKGLPRQPDQPLIEIVLAPRHNKVKR